MNQHRFALALCALVASLALTDIANAYPTTSTTTVKKTYRPLDLELGTLVESYASYTSGLTLADGAFSSLTLVLSGTWAPSEGSIGYTSTGGNAGYWVYQLSMGWDTSTNDFSADRDGDEIIISSASTGVLVGSFTYAGGGTYAGAKLEDTPITGDLFELFTIAAGGQLRITLLDGLGQDFRVDLLKELVHVGPFTTQACPEGGSSCQPVAAYPSILDPEWCLDLTRNTDNCFDPTGTGCGRLTRMSASSVPEPGTVALFGLGIASLGIRFRSRRKAPRV